MRPQAITTLAVQQRKQHAAGGGQAGDIYIGTPAAKKFDGIAFAGSVVCLQGDGHPFCHTACNDGDEEDMDKDEVLIAIK